MAVGGARFSGANEGAVMRNAVTELVILDATTG
jgi:hypothetical protein